MKQNERDKDCGQRAKALMDIMRSVCCFKKGPDNGQTCVLENHRVRVED